MSLYSFCANNFKKGMKPYSHMLLYHQIPIKITEKDQTDAIFVPILEKKASLHRTCTLLIQYLVYTDQIL